MAFSIKTWVDRISEFPNRRRLDGTGITDTFDVTRAEGNVPVEGDKINAANMNDLEGRVKTAIDAVETTANTAVQSATLGGAAVPKSGTTLQLPAYPTSLPANGGNAAYANTAGSAPANGGTANYAHYSSHAVGSGGAALRNNTATVGGGPSGGSDGDGWDICT